MALDAFTPSAILMAPMAGFNSGGVELGADDHMGALARQRWHRSSARRTRRRARRYPKRSNKFALTTASRWQAGRDQWSP